MYTLLYEEILTVWRLNSLASVHIYYIYRHMKITVHPSVRHCCLPMFVISAEEVEVGDKEGQDCFRFIWQIHNSRPNTDMINYSTKLELTSGWKIWQSNLILYLCLFIFFRLETPNGIFYIYNIHYTMKGDVK